MLKQEPMARLSIDAGSEIRRPPIFGVHLQDIAPLMTTRGKTAPALDDDILGDKPKR
jgi:hypothetical protein